MQRQQQGLPDESTNKGAMLFNMPNIQANAQAVAWVRSVMGLVGGICAGVLGLTGGRGLLCFVGFYVLVSLAIVAKAGFKLADALPGAKMPQFLVNGLMGQLMSFLLFWTMFYGLVHVY